MDKISDLFGNDPLLRPMVRRLSHYTHFSAHDIHQLKQLRSTPATYNRGEVFLERDQHTDKVFLVSDGLVAQEILKDDGRTCIVRLLVPGDISDINSALSKSSDVTHRCITTASIVYFWSKELRAILDHNANLKRAFSMLQLTEKSIERELIVALATKSAEQKIAHLLCELSLRLEKVSASPSQAMNIPLTQTELADALGMSSVHVNRVIKRYREENLVTLKGGRICITDWARLASFGEYNSRYIDQHEKSDDVTDASNSIA